MGCLHKNIQLILEFLKALFLVLHFLLYINDLPDDVIAIYADTTLLKMWSSIWSVATSKTGLWTWIWSMRQCGLGQDVACWFQCWKNSLVSFDQSNKTDAIDVKMDGSVLREKSSFKILGLTFSSKLDWGSHIISITKTASKKIGALIHSIKFLLHLFKSNIWPFVEYCCHVWAGAPSFYFELLDMQSF